MYNINKQKKLDILYLDIAKRISEMSYAKRKKVGAVLVKDNNIIGFGWNGTPSGFDNNCEDENNQSKDIVLHSEFNLFSKIAKSTLSSLNSTLYLTLSPCMECSKLIIQSGVKRVVYIEKYRIVDGIDFLEKANIEIDQLDD